MSKSQSDENEFRTDLSDYLRYLQAVGQDVADGFRAAFDESAFASLCKLIEGCQMVVECLAKLGEIHLEYANHDQKKQWSGAEMALSEVVRTSLLAFEKRDFVLVADLVEYELIRTLKLWDEVIRSSAANDSSIQSSLGR
jgi:hypothetical protein